jgi:hypothetical protein
MKNKTKKNISKEISLFFLIYKYNLMQNKKKKKKNRQYKQLHYLICIIKIFFIQ